MSGLTIVNGAEPRRILQAIITEKAPAIMSYLSRGKWHATKVVLLNLGASKLDMQVSPRTKMHPLNIQPGQPVGMSIKYGYGKFIFQSEVLALGPSSGNDDGGIIGIMVPKQIDLVQRRSYFRVAVPKNMEVGVQMWLCRYANDQSQPEPGQLWEGKLVDISAGGVQIAVDVSGDLKFRPGQNLGLKFKPLPDEEPLVFDAQVRNMFPTADDKHICIGMQMVGLEASSRGRSILQRLCNVVERYYQQNQADATFHSTQQMSL